MKIMKRVLAFVLSLAMVVSGIYFVKTEGSEAKAETSTEIPVDMLDVKVQTATNGEPVMRFISSVDSLNYKECGFVINGDYEHPYSITTVFERIVSNTDGVAYKFSPKIVDISSEYFATAKMKVTVTDEETAQGITVENKTYTVQAYVIPLDSDEPMYGATRCVSLADGASNVINLTVEGDLSTAEDAYAAVITSQENKDATKNEYNGSVEVLPAESGYANVRITLTAEEMTVKKLASVTTVSIIDATSQTEVTNGIYRHYENSYLDDGVVDTSWYDIYATDAEKKEFTIATNAEFYGFADLSKNNAFAGYKMYLVSDIVANKGEVSYVSDEDGNYINATWSAENEGDTSYSWDGIGNNNATYAFRGTFDGQGHTISGINCDSDEKCIGLFRQVSYDAEIKNFMLQESLIKSSLGTVGGIVGYVFYTSTISRDYSWSLEAVKCEATIVSGGGYVGGFVGQLCLDANIKNCWFAGDIIGIATPETNDEATTYTSQTYRVGGIAGTSYKTVEIQVNDVSVTGTITRMGENYATDSTNLSIGGLFGDSNAGASTIILNNCLIDANIKTAMSDEPTIGAFAGNAYKTKYTFSDVYTTDTCPTTFVGERTESNRKNNTLPTTGYGTVNKSSIKGISGYTSTEAQSLGLYKRTDTETCWTLTEDDIPQLISFAKKPIDVAWYYDTKVEGTATADDENTYTISTAEELYSLPIIAKENDYAETFAGDTILLGADITLNAGNANSWYNGNVEGVREWTPIGNSNNSVINGKEFAGTFEGGNYTISGLYLDADTTCSGMFATTGAESIIRNFKLVNSCIKAQGGGRIGSVAGDMRGLLECVYSNAIIKTVDTIQVGGLVGVSNLQKGCTKVEINECWFDGIVTATGSEAYQIGGLAGAIVRAGKAETVEINFINSLVTGEITSESTHACSVAPLYVGGLFGDNSLSASQDVTIDNCLVAAKIDVTKASGDNNSHNGVGALIGAFRSGSGSAASLSNTYALLGVYDANGVTGQLQAVDRTVTKANLSGNRTNATITCTGYAESDISLDDSTEQAFLFIESADVADKFTSELMNVDDDGNVMLTYFANWWLARQ